MENDKLQKELFEFEAPKKVLRPIFGQFFQKTDFGITLTVEKLVFISIGIIMLMVIFFAIGVEKGKSLSTRNATPFVPAQTATIQVPPKAVTALVPQARAVATVSPVRELTEKPPSALSGDNRRLKPAAFSNGVKSITPKDRNAVSSGQKKTLTAITNATVETQNTRVLQSRGKPYTIVAAAFLRQDFASKEAAILEGNSLDAFVYYSEPYYLACVGSFANKDSAQKVLSKVRQMHRDAYVRLR